MHWDHNRYFIELQPNSAGPVPRHSEDAVRRAQAIHFMTTIYNWLKTHALEDKVSDVDVTAFGQIQITCTVNVINRIRNEDELSIASIRPGAMYVEGMGQIGRQK